MTVVNPFDPAAVRKRLAWQTTRPLNGLLAALHPADAAIDEMGNIICFSKHGDHASPYGWDIDHRHPKALGGTDHHLNLRALACSTNRKLGGILGSMLR
ncbi:MAG: hypothetical protein ACKOPE_08165 [Novosphingobium sp.]